MDDLKNWTDKNKSEIDSHYDTDLTNLWEGIEQGLDMDSHSSWYAKSWVKWVASILIIFTIGALFLRSGDSNREFTLADLSPELADTEYYYSALLGEKLDIIKTSGIDIESEVFSDLEQLDEAYNGLMIDLKDNADNEEVVQAMISNYRIRLQILEQILSEIEDESKEESDEISI